MKKYFLMALLALACTISPAFADNDATTFGTVESVSPEAKTFNVVGDDGVEYIFHVNEKTEIEMKRKFWFDAKLKLPEVKRGDRVKVEYYNNNPKYLLADEVELLNRK